MLFSSYNFAKNGFDAPVCLNGVDVAGNTRTLNKILKFQLLKSPFPLFFSSFVRINTDTKDNQYKTQSAKKNPEAQWLSFKKIASQAHDNNCLADIGDGLGNKFNFTFRQFPHTEAQKYHIQQFVSMEAGNKIAVLLKRLLKAHEGP